MRRGGRAAAALSLALLAGGCTTQAVTLLPGEAGHPVGAVAVLNEDGSERGLLDTANSRAGLARRRLRPNTLAADRVDRRYGALIRGLPPPPARFVLTFDIGIAEPDPAQEATLQAMLRAVGDRPGAEVEVVGHADALAGDALNERLSRRRAEEVRDFLITRGLAPDQVRASWRGEREPAVATPDGVANVANRRVEIIVR